MLRYTALLVVLLMPVAAAAQTEPGPPGPFVIDLRGAMVSLPNAGEFYPALPSASTIPGRAFGGDIGGHVLFKGFGRSRLGLGVNGVMMRGTVGSPAVTASFSAVAPQLSINFGTADGWSYLSAGYGPGHISTHVPDVEPTPDDDEDDEGDDADEGEETDETSEEPLAIPTTKSVNVGTINFGGGARWFVKRHLAVGFDVRFYRFAASAKEGTPATTRVALSVGVSLR